MGSNPTGIDSIAKPIAPASHWPDMRIIVLVVNDSKKKVSSSVGMKRTLLTDFWKYKTEHVTPNRINRMQEAILNKDFETFAELTMKDSNDMHGACLSAYPPCIYMNDISHLIVELVHLYNSISDRTKVFIEKYILQSCLYFTLKIPSLFVFRLHIRLMLVQMQHYTY